MPSILFICSANQFRSPLAEAFFKEYLKREGIEGTWQVNSAGTWVKEKTSAHPKAIQLAKKDGIDLSSHITQEIDSTLVNKTDLIIVMTEGHKEALQFEFQDQKEKIVMMSEISCGEVYDIPDPAASNFANSEDVYNDLSLEVQKIFINVLKRFSK
jgi:protein-tyrosine phosphatase